MPAPTTTAYDGGHFEEGAAIHTVTIDYDSPVSGNIPVFRFPGPGRVVNAWLVSRFSSSGTNVLIVGLKNGGNVLGGIGTIVVAPTNNGTVTSGSAVQLVCATNGAEVFATGDWVVLNVSSIMTPNASFTVTVDYRLTNF